MIHRFELRRRRDGLVYVFDRKEPDRFKRQDGEYWIIRHPELGWVAWDDVAETLHGRPWNIPVAMNMDAPPEGEWVSKKDDTSYVYDLIHIPD